jgi:hypothetical protein
MDIRKKPSWLVWSLLICFSWFLFSRTVLELIITLCAWGKGTKKPSDSPNVTVICLITPLFTTTLTSKRDEIDYFISLQE